MAPETGRIEASWRVCGMNSGTMILPNQEYCENWGGILLDSQNTP